jgi:hypothetical protein
MDGNVEVTVFAWPARAEVEVSPKRKPTPAPGGWHRLQDRLTFMPGHGRSERTGYKEELDRKVSRSLPQLPHSA